MEEMGGGGGGMGEMGVGGRWEEELENGIDGRWRCRVMEEMGGGGGMGEMGGGIGEWEGWEGEGGIG